MLSRSIYAIAICCLSFTIAIGQDCENGQCRTPVRNVVKGVVSRTVQAVQTVREVQPVRSMFRPATLATQSECQVSSSGCVETISVESNFGRDTDGALIISIEPSRPVVAPTVHSGSVSSSKEPSQSFGSIAGRSDFRQTLLKASRQQRANGEISQREYFSIFVGSLNPSLLEQARLATIDSAIQDGVLQAEAVGAIDWERLIELVIKYLPLIIDLFTK